jgi:hypothetical protein
MKAKDKISTTPDILLPRLKTHYAPYGIWSAKTYCGRYWTTDVKHRGLMDEVTCKRCLELL